MPRPDSESGLRGCGGGRWWGLRSVHLLRSQLILVSGEEELLWRRICCPAIVGKRRRGRCHRRRRWGLGWRWRLPRSEEDRRLRHHELEVPARATAFALAVSQPFVRMQQEHWRGGDVPVRQRYGRTVRGVIPGERGNSASGHFRGVGACRWCRLRTCCHTGRSPRPSDPRCQTCATRAAAADARRAGSSCRSGATRADTLRQDGG